MPSLRRCGSVCLVPGLLWLAWITPLRAQQAVEQVAGRVVSATDGGPLAHAVVSLFDRKAQKPVASTISAEDGSFRLDPVPAGKYSLYGQAKGYLSASYLAHGGLSTAIVTGKGLPTAALRLQLEPAASITGHLTDEAGDPVPDAMVTLYLADPAATTWPVRRANGATTYEDGNFAFSDLAPGRYFLSASGTPWYAVHVPAADAQDDYRPYRAAVDPALDVAYPTVFYPHALRSEEASPIVLAGGENVAANLVLVAQHALTIMLPRTALGMQNPSHLQLFRSAFGLQEGVNVQADFTDGVLHLAGVAPGAYSLQQMGNAGVLPFGSQQLSLTDSLTLNDMPNSPLATVHLTVHPAAGTTLGPDLRISLRPPGSERAAQRPLSDKGTADIPDLPPGEYRFTLYGSGPFRQVDRLLVDGNPVPNKLLRLTGGGTVTVDVQLAGSLVKVEGVAQRNGKAAAASMVILVPAGGDTDEALFRRDQSDLDGSFILHNVQPGHYLLIALDDAWALHWTDPAVLTPYLLHATPLDITADGPKVLQLPQPVSAQPR